MLGITGKVGVYAATTPSLGAAATYGVLANTYTNSAAGTTVNGDVGFLVAPTVEPAPIGGHTNYGSGPPYAAAGADQATALATLNAEPCTFTWGAAVDLALDATHGTPGVYTPGVYCTAGAMNVTGPLTFNGSGTYIFRAGGALGTTAGIGVNLTGDASSCDVFWTPHATTLGAGTSFVGNLFDNDAVTAGAGTSILGRILAFNGPVTTATTTINLPTCTPPPATLHVIKHVVNNSGGTATASDFNMHVKLSGTDVTGSPAAGAEAPGIPYSLSAGTYNVSEDANVSYAQSFSGDCDSSGNVTLASGNDKICTITNNDIAPVIPPVPPLIDVLKVPSPLNLPSGPGLVTYTFTFHNIGTVPVTNITMVDDSCSPVTLISGDTNSNNELEVSETWTYTCSTTLSATHTNNVVATGEANGLTATDTASATVIVGIPLVPPLIHVTKVPNPLTLPAGGGMVTYTEIVTNPGTVALSNVTLTDDKCSPVNYVSGDSNSDSRLDNTETWAYTCQSNLTSTTTNTAMVSGEANGLTATDVAISTVVVAAAVPIIGVPAFFVPVSVVHTPDVPKLPNAGIGPDDKSSALLILVPGVIILFLIYLVHSSCSKTKKTST